MMTLHELNTAIEEMVLNGLAVDEIDAVDQLIASGDLDIGDSTAGEFLEDVPWLVRS